MLYEIYQLKISLNITDDSDTDEELEDLIHAQKLLSVSGIRPPTPPKILNENKVMEKLEFYQKMMKAERSPRIIRKSVLLVDANPELLVTERDLLISLVEAGVDPKQVQRICKNLRHKSRDVDLVEPAQVDTETLYSSDWNVDNSESENNNKKITKEAAVETETAGSARDNSVADNSTEPSEKQEANSSNFIATQDEAVETEEKTESDITSEHDKAES